MRLHAAKQAVNASVASASCLDGRVIGLPVSSRCGFAPASGRSLTAGSAASRTDNRPIIYTIDMSFSASADPVVETVRAALSTVEDPELGVDIVSLGLVYAIEHEQGRVRIVHTLTSMGCPLGPVIERDIDDALAGVEEIESVDVQLVFEPPWSPERMSDDTKFLLGMYG
jgi:metal-sulfur cluster biosynthetic enzyme